MGGYVCVCVCLCVHACKHASLFDSHFVLELLFRTATNMCLLLEYVSSTFL